MPVILVIALVLVAVIIVQFIQQLLLNQYSRATATLADALGLKYSEEQQPAQPVIKGNYLLFAQGMPYSRRDIMEGLYKGVDLAVYSYTFVLNLGKVQEQFIQSVIQFRNVKTIIPQFTLFPHSQIDAILATLILKESRDSLLESAGTRLPGHPDFRKRYKLIGYDQQKLRAIFDRDTVVDTILAIDAKSLQGLFCMEGSGADLIIYTLHKRVPVRFLQDFIDKSIHIAQQMELVPGA